MPDATIIIPAYNEEAGLPGVLRQISNLEGSYEVIVVDDGSTDRTVEVAMQYPVKIRQHDTNEGKGSALLTGFYAASYENIVWIDADGSYPVSVIPLMVDALNNEYDGVVCSRASGRQNIPAFNRIGNWLFSVLIRGIYGFTPQDPCTGLYAMKWSHLLRMGLTSKRFAIEPEISIKAGRMGLKLYEFPIEYQARVGETKLNSIVVGLDDLWTIVKLIGWKAR